MSPLGTGAEVVAATVVDGAVVDVVELPSGCLAKRPIGWTAPFIATVSKNGDRPSRAAAVLGTSAAKPSMIGNMRVTVAPARRTSWRKSSQWPGVARKTNEPPAVSLVTEPSWTEASDRALGAAMALPEAARLKVEATTRRRPDRQIRLFMASSPWGIERLVGSRSLVKTLSNESNDLGKSRSRRYRGSGPSPVHEA